MEKVILPKNTCYFESKLGTKGFLYPDFNTIIIINTPIVAKFLPYTCGDTRYKAFYLFDEKKTVWTMEI